MGGRVFYIGELGQASVIKVITNMLAFIHLVADGEALMLARRGGVDLRLAWDVIKASSGNSFVHETEGQLILNGSYNINFTLDLARKDLFFAHQMGREFGVPLELGGLTEHLRELVADQDREQHGRHREPRQADLAQDVAIDDAQPASRSGRPSPQPTRAGGPLKYTLDPGRERRPATAAPRNLNRKQRAQKGGSAVPTGLVATRA